MTIHFSPEDENMISFIYLTILNIYIIILDKIIRMTPFWMEASCGANFLKMFFS